MRKKRKRKLNKFALGGALVGSALFITFSMHSPALFAKMAERAWQKSNNPALSLGTTVFSDAKQLFKTSLIFVERAGLNLVNLANAYDQQNTHPALTDEAVDFYNLNFTGNQLSQEDKALLIRGAIEEDTPPRWLNHFYDPVYNKGWIGYTTSKEWGISSITQRAFTDSAYSYGGFANLFSDNLSPTDFSYERALHDYASGNRKRAMLAMGHVMHLLEDSNVPEHTRGDTHLPWHGTESPYEKTMAKWNQNNINIASELFKKFQKPILLNQVGDYFDELAGHSNGYFFSEDTILSTKYPLPKIIETQRTKLEEKLLAIGLDKNSQKFNLAILNTRKVRNVFQISRATLLDEEFGNLILDDYWSRLAPDFVAHGAGALKLFLEQAEKVKREYAQNEQLRRRSSGLIGQFLGFLGFSSGGEWPVIFDPAQIESIINQPAVLGENTNDDNSVDDVANGVGNDVRSSPTPSPTPFIALVSSSPSPLSLGSGSNGQSNPSPSPLFYGGSGGSGNGSSSNNTTPSPSPSSSPIPTPTPTSTLSATPTPTPSETTTPTPTPTSTLTSNPSYTPTPTPIPIPTPSGQIVINEIGWMGTGSTATLSNDEWLELYNPTSSPVDVGGWRLVSLTDNSPNITLTSKTIAPYEFFLLERTSDDTISDISADQIYTGNLNDGGEILELRDGDENLIDFVGSLNASGQADTWYAGDKTTRSSMERIDPLKPGDDLMNWATNNSVVRNGLDAAGNQISGTPRARNSAYADQPPSAVLDLIVDSVSSFFGKIRLIWSAPKDNDTSTSQLKYDVRYATHSFDTMFDWDTATKVATSSIPIVVAPFANTQSASFSIFDYNRDYHFAIKTTDGIGWSDISNQPKYTIKPAISGNSTAFRGPANPSFSWQFELPAGFNVGQPGLAGDGTIYFGSSNNFQGRLYAINPDGTEKWHLGGFSNKPPAYPVVADDGTVYFSADSQVYAVNPDMSIRWQYAGASGPIGRISIDANGNIMFTDTANVPVNDRVFKIKPNGTAKWSIFLLTASGFTPIAGLDGDIYNSSRLGVNGIPRYYRLNGDNGAVVWQVSPSANFIYSTGDLAYDQAENKLYATGASGFRIFTINPSDEQLTEDERLIEDMIKPFAANPTTKVTISGDLLVVGATLISNNPSSGSAVYGIDKADKSVHWTFPISASASANPYNSIVNKEIIADVDGNLYFSTKDGRVFSIDQDGQERWIVDTGIVTNAYPVLGDNAVFISAGGKLFKISD